MSVSRDRRKSLRDRALGAAAAAVAATRRKDEEWRWWTVLPPALLTFAASFFSVVVVAFPVTAMNCFDTCYSVGRGMAVGVAGEVIVSIAAIVLVVAGVIVPAWREAIAAVLWVAFVFACVFAALVVTAVGPPLPG
jgi:hypothetical protein